MKEPHDEYFYARIYHSLKPMVTQYCCLYLSQKENAVEVQNIVQNIFIKVFKDIERKRITNISLLRSYILHITKRYCIH